MIGKARPSIPLKDLLVILSPLLAVLGAAALVLWLRWLGL